jgi:hypothetical protein
LFRNLLQTVEIVGSITCTVYRGVCHTLLHGAAVGTPVVANNHGDRTMLAIASDQRDMRIVHVKSPAAGAAGAAAAAAAA